jgi:hypothetical protein
MVDNLFDDFCLKCLIKHAAQRESVYIDMRQSISYTTSNKIRFRVLLYPLTLLLFCTICLFMLYSSLAFTGGGSFVGVCVLLTGIPLIILQKKRRMTDKKHINANE